VRLRRLLDGDEAGVGWTDALLTFAVAAASADLFLLISFQNEGPIFRTWACRRVALAIIGTTAAISTVGGLILASIPLLGEPLAIAAVLPSALSARRLRHEDTDLGVVGAVISMGIGVLVQRLGENLSEAGNAWAESMIGPRWTLRRLDAAGMHYYRRLHVRVRRDPERSDQLEVYRERLREALDAKDREGARETLRIMLEHAYQWGGHRWPRYDPAARPAAQRASRSSRSTSRVSSGNRTA
jgi:hypothetical protein